MGWGVTLFGLPPGRLRSVRRWRPTVMEYLVRSGNEHYAAEAVAVFEGSVGLGCLG
jgi:hypothetical protein